MRTKLICYFAALGLTMTAFAGCSSAAPQQSASSPDAVPSTSNAEQSSQTPPAATDPDEWEYISAANEPIVLTMFNNHLGDGECNWGNDIISQSMEAATGVKLEITQPLTNDNQKLNLMLASGKDLPDIILFESVSNPALQKMIDAEMLHNLDGLMTAYAPKMAQMPLITANRKYYEEGNGEIYYIPSLTNDQSKAGDHVTLGNYAGYVIRNDLYKAIGSPSIKTPDDLESALVMAKEQYPELTFPYLLSYTDDYTIDHNGIQANYYSFGGTGRYFNDNGQIKSFVRDPKFKESLQFLNRLYSKGLINIASFTDKIPQMEANIEQGKTFVISGGIYLGLDFQAALRQTQPEATYEVLEPPLAEGVSQYAPPGPLVVSPMSKAIAITTACKAPDRAIKFLEFLATDEGQAMGVCGREGMDYDKGGPENKYYVVKGDFEATKADHSALVDKFGYLKYAWIGYTYPNSAYSWGNALSDPQRMEMRKYQASFGDYSMYEGIEPVPGSDEDVIRVKIMDLIKVYVPKIVLAENADEAGKMYDEFIAKAEAFELSKLETVYTNGYQKNTAN